MSTGFKVEWLDGGREARCPPDPRYPDGMKLDLARKQLGCWVELPYPAPRCGTHLIICETCGVSFAITAAGRPDDPRTVRVPCRIRGLMQ